LLPSHRSRLLPAARLEGSPWVPRKEPYYSKAAGCSRKPSCLAVSKAARPIHAVLNPLGEAKVDRKAIHGYWKWQEGHWPEQT
jgi:hypothetical protein